MTKVVEIVNKKETRKMIIEKILPAIREKFPRSDTSSPIYIQQGNAKLYLAMDDPSKRWMEFATIMSTSK